MTDVPNPILTETIDRLCRSEALTTEETSAVLHEVMEGRTSEIQTAALLIAFRAKGETVGELAGMARAMRDLAIPVTTDLPGLVDTAGTGGGRPTFNVSTTAAFVAAGAGVPMAKHGNRSATGRSGSADVLEALGARIDLSPEQVAACIEEIGFGFMFAPGHHPAMKHVGPVRKGLAVRTVFNFLGPLTNPAGATREILGVSDRRFLDIMAGALGELGCEHALLVASDDGLDELSTSGPTHVVELRGDGHLDAWTLNPADVGLEPAPQSALAAGTPERNAQIATAVLAGEAGPERDLTALNAGAAIYVGGLSETIEQGTRKAEQAIDSGAARDVLERYVAKTQEATG